MQAMRLMDRLNDYDDLGAQLREVRDWTDLRQRSTTTRSATCSATKTPSRCEQLSRDRQMLEEAGLHPEEPARLRAHAAGRAQDRREGADRYLPPN